MFLLREIDAELRAPPIVAIALHVSSFRISTTQKNGAEKDGYRMAAKRKARPFNNHANRSAPRGKLARFQLALAQLELPVGS